MNELELVAWVKGGKNRYDILKLLSNSNYLPSEIAHKLNKHRASISRTMNELVGHKLIFSTAGNSRAKLYSITLAGKKLLEKIKNSCGVIE